MPYCGDKCEFVIGGVVSVVLPTRVRSKLNA